MDASARGLARSVVIRLAEPARTRLPRAGRPVAAQRGRIERRMKVCVQKHNKKCPTSAVATDLKGRGGAFLPFAILCVAFFFTDRL